MTQELERLKTTCLAQEAEIARLNQAFEDLKNWLNEQMDLIDGRNGEDFDDGVIAAHCSTATWVNTNFGIEK